MTGDGNNTYLVVDDGEGVLIDAGVGHPDHLAELGQTLNNRSVTLAGVAVTHGHTDHASGAPAIRARYPNARFFKHESGPSLSDPNVPWTPVVDGSEVAFGRDRLTVLHTPGHSPDHVAFWHASSRSVFSGDLVIPGLSVVIDIGRGGRLSDYLASLERLRELEPRQLFPAHGPVVDNPQRVVAAHIGHRLERERQVIRALEAGHRTVEAIAESIYDRLDPRLMAAARNNVRAHLDKLRAEGVAAEHDEGWTI